MSAPQERVTIDPLGEDPRRGPLDLVGLDPSWGIYLLTHDYTPPDLDQTTAGSADTEGDPFVQSRYPNRVLSYGLRIVEPIDAAATNMIVNPSFESDFGSWAAYTSAATLNDLSLSSAWRSKGDQSAHFKATGTGGGAEASIGYGFAAGAPTAAAIPAAPGQVWALRCRVNLVTLTPPATGIEMGVIAYSAANAFLGYFTAASARTTAVGEADLAFATPALPATTAKIVVFVGPMTGSLVGVGGVAEFYVDAVQAVRENAVSGYFDGDTPGCDWTGARDNSTSTRPAPGGARFWSIVRDLSRKLDRINKEQGTVRRVPAGAASGLTYDVKAARFAGIPQDIGVIMRRCEPVMEFDAAPFGRGAEIQIGGNYDETVKPANEFVAASPIPGDVSALGRLVIADIEAGGKDRWLLRYGGESRFYDATQPLQYDAETRTLLGGATSVARTGAFGGNVVQKLGTVSQFQTIWSIQASGGGAFPTHKGDYLVIARFNDPQNAPLGTSVAMQYADGDLTSYTRGTPPGQSIQEVTLPVLGFSVVELGTVSLKAGRWDLQILARTLGAQGTVELDWVGLIPLEVAGKVELSPKLTAPSSFGTYDDVGSGSGSLTGRALVIPTPQTWANATAFSSAVDFTYGSGIITRSTNDAGTGVLNTGRGALAGTATYASLVAQMDFRSSNLSSSVTPIVRQQMILRYKNATNWLVANVSYGNGFNYVLALNAMIAGSLNPAPWPLFLNLPPLQSNTWYTLTAFLDASGRYALFVTPQGVAPTVAQTSGQRSELATGGAVDSGQVGIADVCGGAGGPTRDYDNVAVWTPPNDAVVFGTRSAEWRWDQVRRLDSGGTNWGKKPAQGDYLLVPNSGKEGRLPRFLVHASRNSQAMGDPALDDLRCQLFVQPRYWIAPPT